MTSTTDRSLVELRQTLRRKLTAQRSLIARRLEPASDADGGYPRSMTMRFLTRRPALTAGLLAGLTALLVGRRFFSSLTAALALARIMHSAASAVRSPPRPVARASGNGAEPAP